VEVLAKEVAKARSEWLLKRSRGGGHGGGQRGVMVVAEEGWRWWPWRWPKRGHGGGQEGAGAGRGGCRSGRRGVKELVAVVVVAVAVATVAVVPPLREPRQQAGSGSPRCNLAPALRAGAGSLGRFSLR